MSRQTVAQWITECLVVSEKADLYGAKKCTGFSLVHVAGGSRIELKTVKIGARAHDPKELARLFEGTAENFAGGVPGVQQFELLAFYDDNDQPQSRYPLRKAADPDHAGIGTEAPTTAGVTSQMMRLTEAAFRISNHHGAELFRLMDKVIERQDKRIETLEREQHDAIELAVAVVQKSATDQHSRMIELLKLKQSAKDREAIMRVLPAVANRVLGKEIFPQGVADTAIFEHLAESLDEDQIKKMSVILRPEQWAFVADRLVEVLKKKQAREVEEKRLEESAKENGGAIVTTATEAAE
jgi:hypothetical protein